MKTVFVIFLFCVNTAIAQEVTDKPAVYNLIGSVNMAMQRNEDVQKALRQIEYTKGDLLVHAAEDNLPQLEYTRTESFSRSTAKKTIRNTAGVDQVLYRFGEENVTEREAFRTARTAYVEAMNDAIYDVRTTFFNILILEKQMKERKTLLEGYQEKLKREKAKYELGEKREVDVLEVELQIANEEININNLERDLDYKKTEFITLIGASSKNFILEGTFEISEFDVGQAIKYAIDRRIEIKDLLEDIKIQKGIVRESLWKSSPDITLTATEGRFFEKYDFSLTKDSDDISLGFDVRRDPTYTYMDGENRDQWGYSISISLPIFGGLNMAGERRKEIANLEKLKLDLEKKKDDIRLGVENAYTEFLNTQDSFNLQKRQMDLKKKKWDIMLKLVDIGEASYYETLQAQDDFISEEETYFAMEIDYMEAQEDLSKAMGEYYKYMGAYLKYWE